MRFINLKDKRFKRLIVLGRTKDWISSTGRTKNVQWLCRCDCGKDVLVRTSKLRDGSTSSCGCYRSDKVKLPRTPKGHSGLTDLFLRYKKQARDRSLVFKLNLKEFKEITKKECFYCGIKPYQVFTPACRLPLATQHGKYIYNGIDRRDNKKGYTLGNSVPCCGLCNQAKSNLTYNEFIFLVKNIARRH